MKLTRGADNPIISPALSTSIGTNINGPSLIRVPDWVESPLGRYYLYFAHHKGKCIRLAYSDRVTGPYTVYEPGALLLEHSLFPTEMRADLLMPEVRQRLEQGGISVATLYTHIASPDVIIDAEAQQIRLYYHGMLESGVQASRVAVSRDGLVFDALPTVIANPYLRMLRWDGEYLGMAMPGVFYRTRDGLTGFERGPTLFNRDMRHAALLLRGSVLNVFWTQVGYAPERILLSTIDIVGDWSNWKVSDVSEILRPEMAWEGSALPVVASVRGAIEQPANQLRDPCIFEEGGDTWLLYAIAGESGIAVAGLTDDAV